jgi:hypothetical protein
MNTIASLETIGTEFDTGAKFFRLMAKEGVTLPHLQRVIDNASARRNLAAYLAAGCPKLSKADTTPVPPAPKPAVLKLVNDSVQLGAVASHNPQKFFKTRKGLWVSDEFRSRILSKAKPVENLDALTLVSRELTKNAYDREISPELGENYIFDESEVCARIEQMISKQAGGTTGDLLNNGYANLFNIAGCVVYVYWFAGDRE